MKNIRFDAPISIEAAGGGSNKRPRFSILAYTGTPVRVGGFANPVTVDLNGLHTRGDNIPILLDHDSTKIVGQTDFVRISASGVELTGTITGDNSHAQEIVSHARNGFQWRASIGASIIKQEYLQSGHTTRVNGREVTGPLVIAREAELFETSFVAIPADPETAATIAAKDTSTMPTEPITDTSNAIKADRVLAVATMTEGFPAIFQKAIELGWDDKTIQLEVREAKINEHELTQLRAERASVTVPIAGGGSYGRSNLEAAAMLMAGHHDAAVKHYGEGAVRATRKPNGWTDLFAMALQSEGRPVPHERSELIKAGFSTASIPNVLSNVQTKLALDTFIEQSANWRPLVRVVPVKDFKEGKAVRLTSSSRFEQVPPGGEIPHGYLEDDAFSVQIHTYGKMFGLTRQAIINDDLGLLSDLPRILGSEGARGVADAFFDLLIANTGSPAYYSSTNGNLLEAGSALDIASLSDAIKTLRTRVDGDGRLIGFQPKTLVVPANLETTARALLNSTTLQRDQDSDNQPTGNPMANIVSLVVEPRLDAASTTAWYLFGSQNDAAFLVAFLDGKQSPTVEQQDAPFNTLGLQWRAYLDWGVSQGEPMASVKATGQS